MKKNVLLIDDFEPNLLVLESILEGMPINILKASNGEDALSIVLRQQIDIILLDVKIPDINGYEIARLIRTHRKTKHIPIIFLSGLIDQEYSDFIKTYPGNVECFQKPFDVDDVIMRVNHYI